MTFKHVTLGCFLAFSVALPASAAETRAVDTNPAIAVQASPASVPPGVALGSAEDEKRYAEREAASPDAKKYRGGDVIVVSAGAIAIALLVVLILVLL